MPKIPQDIKRLYSQFTLNYSQFYHSLKVSPSLQNNPLFFNRRHKISLVTKNI
nr:MAG TPA: hypothetical protein [Caudoviricetes sp.]